MNISRWFGVGTIATLVASAVLTVAGFAQPVAAEYEKGSSPSAMKYLVGLGDSRAAGGGLPVHGDDSPSDYDAACERSPYASIAYLAAATNTPVVNYACVGATTDDLYSSDRFNKQRVPAQLKQVEDFVLKDSGTVFVVQTGANDLKWSAVLARCAKTTCGEKKRDNVALRLMLKNYERRLEKAIKTFRKNGAEGLIVLAGTYNPVPSDQELLDRYGISDAERRWLDDAVAQLNTKTADIAAKHDNVEFAPISLQDGQLQTMDDPMPFHPTISGQQSIARQLQDTIESRFAR